MSTSRQRINKRISSLNEIFDETFLIIEVILKVASLLLRRKDTSDKQYQRFHVERICNDYLQTLVDIQFDQWKEQHKNDPKILQRDIDQTKQNIIYNVFIQALKEIGIKIESFERKKSKKIIPRRRLSFYNGMTEEETRKIGEKMNQLLIQKLPLKDHFTKKECMKIISSSDILNIDGNQVQQSDLSHSENLPNIQSFGAENHHGSNMEYISQNMFKIQTQNGEMNVTYINGNLYQVVFVTTIDGNNIPLIVTQNEQGLTSYFSVVCDSNNALHFIPYEMVNIAVITDDKK